MIRLYSRIVLRRRLKPPFYCNEIDGIDRDTIQGRPVYDLADEGNLINASKINPCE